VRRTGASLAAVEALATAGAFGCFDLERREALWAAGAVAQGTADRLSGVVTAVAQTSLFEALDRARVTVVAPLVGTGVLWTVVFAAIFLGRSELIGRRLVMVALLVVAGGALVSATR
jgi:drug/metabolite transporter (DMT)-like permease